MSIASPTSKGAATINTVRSQGGRRTHTSTAPQASDISSPVSGASTYLPSPGVAWIRRSPQVIRLSSAIACR